MFQSHAVLKIYQVNSKLVLLEFFYLIECSNSVTVTLSIDLEIFEYRAMVVLH